MQKKTATTIQENAEDIYFEAQQINDERVAQEEEFDSWEDVDYAEDVEEEEN